MIRPLALAALMLTVSACGARAPLRALPGSSLPIQGETAAARPTPEQLMTPDTQARPKRTDEQLRKSEERREDRFDLPPT